MAQANHPKNYDDWQGGVLLLDGSRRIITWNTQLPQLMPPQLELRKGAAALDVYPCLDTFFSSPTHHPVPLTPAPSGPEGNYIFALGIPMAENDLLIWFFEKSLAGNVTTANEKVIAGLVQSIRTPLSIIQGGVQLLGRMVPDQGDINPIIQDITAKVRELNGIMEDLALLAFREAKPWLVPVDLMQILKDTVAPYPEGRIAVENRIDNPWVLGDPFRLSRALGKLLDNAMEASPGSDPVTVSIGPAAKKDWLEISIHDDGAGIPPAIQPWILLPFFSTKETRPGMGLKVARKLIQLQKGQLRIASSPGKGTTVTILLRKGEAQ